jgi:hypothetical protein
LDRGRAMVRALRAAGLGTRHPQRVPEPTGGSAIGSAAVRRGARRALSSDRTSACSPAGPSRRLSPFHPSTARPSLSSSQLDACRPILLLATCDKRKRGAGCAASREAQAVGCRGAALTKGGLGKRFRTCSGIV